MALKDIRNRKRLSQEQLARMANVTTKTVQRAEAGSGGRRNVSARSWSKLARALHVSPSELWEDQP